MKIMEAAASVRGSSHVKDKIKNQDAFLIKNFSWGTVIAVSDGHGSMKYSDEGARAACRAVYKSVKIWNMYKNKDIRLIIPLIHSIWRMEIYPHFQEECGATCLFVFISNEGKIYAGLLGDGALCIEINGKFEVLKEKEDEFSNLTSGLGGISGFNEWKIKEWKITDKSSRIKICLMTDGVSESLISGRKKEFVRLLWKKTEEKENSAKRKEFLREMLKDWPKANAGDDRTAVIYMA